MKLLSTGLLCTAALATASPLAAQGEPMTFTEESFFAVVTHRGGIAGRLAHNHLVVADRYLADFTFDRAEPQGSALRFSTLVDDLTIDDPARQEAWIDRIRTLGLLEEFGDLDEDTRAEVRAEMLSEDQLDPENHPVIAAVLTGIREGTTRVGQVDFSHMATVDVTVHGVTVSREVPLRWEQDGDALVIEALGRFTFEEFGIEPYSAFLGSVKVENEFEIYLNLRAVPAESTG